MVSKSKTLDDLQNYALCCNINVFCGTHNENLNEDRLYRPTTKYQRTQRLYGVRQKVSHIFYHFLSTVIVTFLSSRGNVNHSTVLTFSHTVHISQSLVFKPSVKF